MMGERPHSRPVWDRELTDSVEQGPRPHSAVRAFMDTVAGLSGIEAEEETVEPGAEPETEVVWVKLRVPTDSDANALASAIQREFGDGPEVEGHSTGVVSGFAVDDLESDSRGRSEKRLRVAVTYD